MSDADPYMRIVMLFDQDETAGAFLREDGEGGFAGAVYRMAREIDRLRAGIKRLSDEEERCAETTGDDPFSLIYLAAKLAKAEAKAKALQIAASNHAADAETVRRERDELIRNMGERTTHIACEHDWFDCSNAAVPPPAKSCRKCGWTVGDDETQGIYLIWPWLASRNALDKERG